MSPQVLLGEKAYFCSSYSQLNDAITDYNVSFKSSDQLFKMMSITLRNATKRVEESILYSDIYESNI